MEVNEVDEVDELVFKTTVGTDKIALKRTSKMEKRELVYVKEKCTGCGMCYEACPMDAIEFGPSGAATRNLIEPPTVVIDPEKCVHCGICAGVCMFKALDLFINDISTRDSDRFLGYEKVFDFNLEKCDFKDKEAKTLCEDCEIACPTDAIKCKIVGKGKKAGNTIDFEEELCIYCKACEKACPEDAIKVEKFYEGDIEVDLDTCDGCGVCVEVCPTDTITQPKAEIGERADKIVIDKDACIYCKACEKACPVDALKVERNSVKLRSGATAPWTNFWKKAFEDLASNEKDMEDKDEL